MKLFTKTPLPLAALVLVGIISSSSIAAAQLTESDVLASIADKGIRPSLSGAAESAGKLSNAVGDLCQKRNQAAFATAQDAWKKAYMAWRKSVPLQIGPATSLERQLGKKINNTVLNAAVDDASLKHLLKNQDVRGYAAAEYLLFVPTDAAAATAAGRCDHLQDVTAELAAVTDRARQEWDKGFGREFTAAGDGKPYLVPGDALSLPLARALNTIETLLRDGIGFPSNFFTGKARPDTLDAWHSNNTLDSFRATLDGLHLAIVGDGSTGLTTLIATKDGLLHKRNPGLAAEIGRQLDQTKATIAKLSAGQPLYDQVKKKPATLKKLYKDLQKLQDQLVEASLVLELDVRSAMETSVAGP